MIITEGNGYCDLSSNLDEVVCISHNTNILGKSMNPTIIVQAMDKLLGR